MHTQVLHDRIPYWLKTVCHYHRNNPNTSLFDSTSLYWQCNSIMCWIRTPFTFVAVLKTLTFKIDLNIFTSESERALLPGMFTHTRNRFNLKKL